MVSRFEFKPHSEEDGDTYVIMNAGHQVFSLDISEPMPLYTAELITSMLNELLKLEEIHEKTVN